GALLGLDREVHAIAARGGCGPYVAGGFVSDGTGRELQHVARWTGEAWERVGDAAFDVRQLEIATTGELFAAGFASEFAGSAFGDTVWRLRGGAFEEIGRAMGVPSDRTSGDGEVLGMAAGPDGRVYVTGSFVTIGGVAARNVAVFDGEGWQALGEGVDGWIEDVAVLPDGRPVVVGRIGTDSADVGTHVAIFEDGEWRPLGDLRSLPLSGIAIWRGEVVVVAHLDGRVGAGESLVARYDGTAWHDLGTSDFITVSGGRTKLVASGDTLLLVGQLPLFEDLIRSAKLAVWHGDHWIPFEESTADFGFAAAVTSTGIWLGGRFSTISATPADQIAFFELESVK
ncbi:MAG: Rax2 family protein, partial [Myxococcota bacterium]|nr:Rax2 family protein [Myxococcota bacterium]